jgi:hypothetical protein
MPRCSTINIDIAQFHAVSEHDLIPGSTAGYTFTTLTLDTPAYMDWLLARYLSGGGITKRANLQHISQVMLIEYLSCEIFRSVHSGDISVGIGQHNESGGNHRMPWDWRPLSWRYRRQGCLSRSWANHPSACTMDQVWKDALWGRWIICLHDATVYRRRAFFFLLCFAERDAQQLPNR